jgi:hypothetical protein
MRRRACLIDSMTDDQLRQHLDDLAGSARCNALKVSLTEPEFRELLTLLALFHPTARADVGRLAGGRRYARPRGKP